MRATAALADRHIHARRRIAGGCSDRAGNERASGQSASRRVAAAPSDEGAIIVTATKRASTVQDVPFSINAQTQADIERAQRRRRSRTSAATSRASRSRTSARARARCRSAASRPGRSFAISRASRSRSASTSTKVRISLSLFTPDFDLFDLNRVETLRGPQGTLFGAGSVGGTIRYITNQPKLDGVEGRSKSDVNVAEGRRHRIWPKGAVNIPLGHDRSGSRSRL